MIRRKIAARRQQRRSNNHPASVDEWDDVIEEEEDLPSSSQERESCDNDDETSLLAKMWSEEDKTIYEQQLEHLHGQLEGALIDNQELKMRIRELEGQMGQPGDIKSSRKMKRRETPYGSYRGKDVSVTTTGEGFQHVSVSATPNQSSPNIRRRSWDAIKDYVFNFLYDFTDESMTLTEEDMVKPPLQAKRLKDNLQRFVASSKPYREFVASLIGILQWVNPSLTLVAFLVYMYAVWNGWIIQLVLLTAITYLSINYLRVIHMMEQFGFGSKQVDSNEEQVYASLRLTDKFQLIREVGQTVQNTSDEISNHLEKGQNLLLWRQPQATRKIFNILCVAFVITLFLPTSYTITLAGLGIGFKLFIIDNIYRKYPKVKDKYDGMARLWNSLPTNAELEQRQSLTEYDVVDESGGVMSSVTTSLSFTESSFCERFQLSLDETPLDNWQSGKKCTLLDKDRPLVGSKSGRLYLTHSCLCFERSPRPTDNTDRFVIPLTEIESISRAKPFAVLPGSGMSIEILRRNSDKSVIFGAILHRDQAYQYICDQAMIIGLPWGSDPDHTPSSSISLEGSPPQDDSSDMLS